MHRLYIAHLPLEGRSGHDTGRLLLQRLYRQVMGRPLPPVAVTPRGKPYFEDGLWHFSISHTPSHAFCAMADCPVGIDAEESDRRVDPRLAQRILSPSEYAEYAAAADPNRALLTFWVLKEAAAKCSGQGIRYPANQTGFSLKDTRIFEEAGCIVAVITEDEDVI